MLTFLADLYNGLTSSASQLYYFTLLEKLYCEEAGVPGEKNSQEPHRPRVCNSHERKDLHGICFTPMYNIDLR